MFSLSTTRIAFIASLDKEVPLLRHFSACEVRGGHSLPPQCLCARVDWDCTSRHKQSCHNMNDYASQGE